MSKFSALLGPELRPAFRQDGIWLVRPDGYVACAATEPGVIANYLDALIRPSGSSLPAQLLI